MTKRLLPALLALLLVFSSGCVFSKKPKRPKESSAIAGEVEESFRRRWVDRRTGELMAQGTAADVARTRAETEFRERYDFSPPGRR